MKQELRILMIDDDPDDHYITKDVLKELNSEIDIHFISDSSVVFDHLSNSASLPNLILLDKHLPGIEGIDILRELKSHAVYKMIPVVVLSGSASPDEVQQIYALGASSFITKPSTGAGTTEKIAGFLNYWMNICELPAFEPLSAPRY